MKGPNLGHIVFVLFIFTKTNFVNCATNHRQQEPEANEYEEYAEPMKKGVLRKFESLVHWAMKEEQIFELATARHQRLKFETELLEKYADKTFTFCKIKPLNSLIFS
jgi:hypothetical protein